MLHLTFYKNLSDPRTIDKNLVTVGTATAAPTETVNLLTPRLVLNFNSNLLSANYCYISEFNRFYYIRNMEINTAQRLEIGCDVDVLKSHATQIKNCNVIAERSETKYNLYLRDQNAPTEQKTQVQIKKLVNAEKTLGGATYIMISF